MVADEFIVTRDEANEVYNNASATQEEVNGVFTRLVNAMHMLEFIKGDKTTLKTFIDKVNELKADKYIETTWIVFEKELAKVQMVYNENVMLEVDETYNVLVKAFLNLRLKPNKDLLSDLINQANGINRANYSAESLKVLDAEVLKAKAVFEDPNASEAKIKAVEVSLTKALVVKLGESVKTGDDNLIGMFTTIALLSMMGYMILRRK
ncbi:hypothetical protein [Thomasclavelia cocleata]|uniref:hypothetical protein n=2 Tax=Thomasclavelia cocleata TaxID=69824 RepID=UPI002432D62C|nr:hypothetical protein [Thomasclavelia cocleata]MCI9629779.1 hypothetical protein [Thomasclavelia cocleata]